MSIYDFTSCAFLFHRLSIRELIATELDSVINYIL